MSSERKHWKKKVHAHQANIRHVSEGLEGSKLFATDIVGEAPTFQPTSAYRLRLETIISNLNQKLEPEARLTARQRGRKEAQRSRLHQILADLSTN